MNALTTPAPVFTDPAKRPGSPAVPHLPPDDCDTLLRELCDDCAEDYHALCDRGLRDPSKPLLVVVHPGDMTEVDPPDWLKRRSKKYQDTLTSTIESWGGDVAILHRQSCAEFIYLTSRCEIGLADELESARRKAILVCYGDDLDQFAAQLAPRVVGRANVLVTGAYRHRSRGCVNTVARLLRKLNRAVKVDPYAYPEP